MAIDPNEIERAAWALFEAHRNGTAKLWLKAGSITGQIAVEPTQRLSEKQLRWFGQLLENAGLPPLTDGGGDASQ